MTWRPRGPRTSRASASQSWETVTAGSVPEGQTRKPASFFQKRHALQIWPESNFQKGFVLLSEEFPGEKPLFLWTVKNQPSTHDWHTLTAMMRDCCSNSKKQRPTVAVVHLPWGGDKEICVPASSHRNRPPAFHKTKNKAITRKIYLSLKGCSDITIMASLQKVCSLLSIHISI